MALCGESPLADHADLWSGDGGDLFPEQRIGSSPLCSLGDHFSQVRSPFGSSGRALRVERVEAEIIRRADWAAPELRADLDRLLRHSRFANKRGTRANAQRDLLFAYSCVACRVCLRLDSLAPQASGVFTFAALKPSHRNGPRIGRPAPRDKLAASQERYRIDSRF